MDDRLKEIRERILEGEIDKAIRLKERRGVKQEHFDTLVEAVFDELINKKKFSTAIDLGKTCDFPEEKIKTAVYPYFWDLFNNKKFVEAAYLGKDYKLSEQNIKNAAFSAIESMIKKKDIKSAIKIVSDFNLPPKEITLLSSQGYNIAFEKGEFKEAAQIASFFDLKKDKLVNSAIKALEIMAKTETPDTISKWAMELNLITEETFEPLEESNALTLSTQFYNYVIKENIEKGNLREIKQIVAEFRFLDDRFKNECLRKLQITVFNGISDFHNNCIKNKEYEKALTIKDSFELLDKDRPGVIKNKIIKCAQEVYSDLIQEDNLKNARQIKTEYKLFTENVIEGSNELSEKLSTVVLRNSLIKGDIKTALQQTKEFDIPKKTFQKVARDLVIDSLQNNKFQEAIEIFEKFKLDHHDRDIENEASRAVQTASDEHLLELASNLGYIFKVEKRLTQKAALNSWGKFMLQARYKDAKKIKDKHRIPKDLTEQIARKVYNNLTNMKKYNEATQIRKEYKINIGFFSLLIQFFKSLFSGAK